MEYIRTAVPSNFNKLTPVKLVEESVTFKIYHMDAPANIDYYNYIDHELNISGVDMCYTYKLYTTNTICKYPSSSLVTRCVEGDVYDVMCINENSEYLLNQCLFTIDKRTNTNTFTCNVINKNKLDKFDISQLNEIVKDISGIENIFPNQELLDSDNISIQFRELTNEEVTFMINSLHITMYL